MIATFGSTPSVQAAPRPGANVGFAQFHDRLAASGTWTHHPKWGDVWHPNGVARDFRPYFDRGHWVYTADYGWFWAGDDDWGDIVYHYGRWVFDPVEGWIWIPGYIWAPAWVYWRLGGGYIGWMPAPPDAAFLTGMGIGLIFADWGPSFYGYRDWYSGQVGAADLWVFVGANHFGDPGFQRYAVPRAQAADLIARTRNVTRYTSVHGMVVNRSITSRSVAALSGHRIRPVAVRTALHGNVPMVHIAAGRAAAARERRAHPVAVHISTTRTRRGFRTIVHHHYVTIHRVTARHYVRVHHVTAHRYARHYAPVQHHMTNAHHVYGPGAAPHFAAPHIGAPSHAPPATRTTAPPPRGGAPGGHPHPSGGRPQG